MYVYRRGDGRFVCLLGSRLRVSGAEGGLIDGLS